MRRVYHFVYKIQDLVIEQLYRRQSIVLLAELQNDRPSAL